MTAYTGIVHVHSDCSYDGKHSLEALVQEAKRRGYRFLGMSEHSDTLDPEKVKEFVANCDRLSSSDCLVMPGIEFTCEGNLHLLGFGVRDWCSSTDPVEVSRFIHAQGGIAVVAHPRRYDYRIPSGLVPELDGIEVWNAAYDGRFIPDTSSLKLLLELRNTKPNLLGFGGQDLHRLTTHMHVRLRVHMPTLCSVSLLTAFREGRFVIDGSVWKVNPKNVPGKIQIAMMSHSRWVYDSCKHMRQTVGKNF